MSVLNNRGQLLFPRAASIGELVDGRVVTRPLPLPPTTDERWAFRWYQDGPDRWLAIYSEGYSIRTVDVDTGEVAILDGPAPKDQSGACSISADGRGMWQGQIGARCYGSYGPRTEGQRWGNWESGVGIVTASPAAHDGTIAFFDVQDGYEHSHVVLYAPDGRITDLGYVADCNSVITLGPTSAMWWDNGWKGTGPEYAGGVLSVGIPGQAWRLTIGGERWLVYYSQDGHWGPQSLGIVAHPEHSLDGYVLVPPGFCYGIAAAAFNGGILLSYDPGAGELPQGLHMLWQDLSLPRVRLELPAPPPPDPVPPVPVTLPMFDHHIHAGWWKDDAGDGPGTCHYVETCDNPSGTKGAWIRKSDGSQICWPMGAGSDPLLWQAANGEVWYYGLTFGDWPLPAASTRAGCEAVARAQAAKVIAAAGGRPILFIGLANDRRKGWTNDQWPCRAGLSDLMRVWYEVARDTPQIRLLSWFARNRAGGAHDLDPAQCYPELLAWADVTTRAIPPEEDDMTPGEHDLLMAVGEKLDELLVKVQPQPAPAPSPVSAPDVPAANAKLLEYDAYHFARSHAHLTLGQIGHLCRLIYVEYVGDLAAQLDVRAHHDMDSW